MRQQGVCRQLVAAPNFDGYYLTSGDITNMRFTLDALFVDYI